MEGLRSKLTYSNLMVTVLAFIVLGGGTALATSHFQNESVGTQALKKEAVTPAKLSKKAKSTLTGPAGPQGATGATGEQGPKGDRGAQGERGPQGPGAVAFELGPTTFTGTAGLTVQVSRELVDKSAIEVDYNPSTEVESAWYQAQGLGSSGSYFIRYFFYQTSTSPSTYTLALRAMKPNLTETLTTPLTFTKVKLVLTPTS
jgi:hypothetical protein